MADTLATDAQGAREARLRSLLGKPIRVTVSDGRVFVGTFACCDNHVNLVLKGAQQVTSDAKAGGTRHLGQILVPGAHLTKIEMYQRDVAPTVPATPSLAAGSSSQGGSDGGGAGAQTLDLTVQGTPVSTSASREPIVTGSEIVKENDGVEGAAAPQQSAGNAGGAPPDSAS